MAAEAPPISPLDRGRPPTSGQVIGQVTLFEFFIDGKPVPKGRPRAAKRGESITVYTDDATLTWEQNVGWQVKQALVRIGMDPGGGDITLPLKGRVLAELRFNFEKPASTSKKVLFPVKSRTDVDNLAKAVLDALQNVGVLLNDNIVTDLYCTKRFVEDGHPQGVEILLTAWAE